MSDETLPQVLKVISNRIRRSIIQVLSDQATPYLGLLMEIGLDPDRHCGWFDYHLGVLTDEGIINKMQDQYRLTDFGRSVATFLNSIKQESQKILPKEVNMLERSEITIRGKAPKIVIEEVPKGRLVISLSHKRPIWQQGERRVYREMGRIPSQMETPWGRNNYEVSTCLARTWFPKKEEYHYLILQEVYTSKYDGTEENSSIVQRTEEGYFLDNWLKIEKVQKRDGIYDVKCLSWGIRGPTEPEETLEAPEKISDLPETYKIGDRSTKRCPIVIEGEKRGETVLENQILGEYIVKIEGKEYDCLFSRGLVTNTLRIGDGKIRTWKRIVEDYMSKDNVIVLNGRYDTGDWLKRHAYKNWENNPQITYEDETYYLSGEMYLAERHLPIVNLGRIKYC